MAAANFFLTCAGGEDWREATYLQAVEKEGFVCGGWGRVASGWPGAALRGSEHRQHLLLGKLFLRGMLSAAALAYLSSTNRP